MKVNLRSLMTLICAPVVLFTMEPIAYGLEAPVAASPEAPPSVTIRDISWAGSGCPAGSVASNVATDNRAFTLAFDEFVASAGPGIPITGNRKNCNLIIDLVFPGGWSFTIFTVDYRGFVQLDPRVTGTQRSAYFFQGQFPSAALRTNLVGPIDGLNYEIRDTLGLDAVIWSPCGGGRALNINSEVRVNNSANRSGSGQLTIDTISGTVQHTYFLYWRRCS